MTHSVLRGLSFDGKTLIESADATENPDLPDCLPKAAAGVKAKNSVKLSSAYNRFRASTMTSSGSPGRRRRVRMRLSRSKNSRFRSRRKARGLTLDGEMLMTAAVDFITGPADHRAIKTIP